LRHFCKLSLSSWIKVSASLSNTANASPWRRRHAISHLSFGPMTFCEDHLVVLSTRTYLDSFLNLLGSGVLTQCPMPEVVQYDWSKIKCCCIVVCEIEIMCYFSL
jgi:hypothetical protein